MRGPRVTGNPVAAGNPAGAGSPAPAGDPAGDADAAAGTRARAGVTPRGRPAGGDGLSAPERGPSPTRRVVRLAGRCLRLAREHWLLTALLVAGLVLRVLAQVAYRPALIYIDSLRYLYHAHGADPVGYRVLLRPLLLVGNLDLVAGFQHVVGLAMAVLLYAVLLRRGVPRWLAALATAPVLLDGYQLQIEQTIMPDVMFEACIVAGLAALLWHPRPRTALIITGGLFLGASATARQVGEIFLLPALAYLLVALPHWRRRLAQGAILCAAFALPILAYCSVALVVTGHFRLSYTGTNELYGRLVLAVDCRELTFPPASARSVLVTRGPSSLASTAWSTTPPRRCAGTRPATRARSAPRWPGLTGACSGTTRPRSPPRSAVTR